MIHNTTSTTRAESARNTFCEEVHINTEVLANSRSARKDFEENPIIQKSKEVENSDKSLAVGREERSVCQK